MTWRRTYAHNDPGKYGNTCDSLAFYTKSADRHVWNQPYAPYEESYIKSHFKADASGRFYQLVTLDAPAHGRPANYLWKGKAPPKGRIWTLTEEKMKALEAAGRIEYTSNEVPRRIYYLDEMPGVPLQSLWADIPPVNSQSLQDTKYPTQKPEALLERIIKASSNESDLVLDCFCGSGTTAAVAEKFNRRWIACDLGRFAIHTTRKRLLGIPNVKPFVVQNLDKYERQAWQTAEFSSPENLREREARYRNFILELYHAEPVTGYSWLHGAKNGRMVHVGAVDAPVTLADVKAIAAEVWRSVGSGAG
ncbi:MAG: DNA methyltransferase, partial [Gammaproteobacteria bacterium]